MSNAERIGLICVALFWGAPLISLAIFAVVDILRGIRDWTRS